ncbi:MAG: DUF4442 domain-containing protein, partial [Myxococcota bacterium]
MTPFEMLKAQLATTVPYATHTGVQIEDIGSGTARATLDQRTETGNHIGSQHAGALFTLGEATSGAAMAGGFLDRLLEVFPVAATAEIAYVKVAKGTITAKASIQGDVDALKVELDRVGKVQFPVQVR